MRCSLLLLTLASSVALTGAAPLGSRLATSKYQDAVVPREPTGLSYAPSLPELHVRSIERKEEIEEDFLPTEQYDKRDDDDDDDDDDDEKRNPNHGESSRLTPGTIAAVAVASILGLLFLVFVVAYCLVIRPRKKKAGLRANSTPKDEEAAAAAANFTTVDLRGGRPDGLRDTGSGGSSGGSSSDRGRGLSSVPPGAIGVALSTPSSHNPSAPPLTSSTSSTSALSPPSPATPGGADPPRAAAPSYHFVPPAADRAEAEAVAAIIATGAADDKSAPPRYYPSVVASAPQPQPSPLPLPLPLPLPPLDPDPDPDPDPSSRLPPTAPPPEDLTPLYDYRSRPRPYQQEGDHNHRYFHMGQTPSSPPEYEQAVSPLTPPGSPPPTGPFRLQRRQQQQQQQQQHLG